jgi:ATP synthase protein I
MVETPPARRPSAEDAFSRTVGAQERRKLRTARHGTQVWSGLGMLGLVGWSVGTPTLLGVFVGLWLDRRFPSPHSWTLTLLFAGLFIGCFTAWHWITKEQKEIHREEDEK